MNRSLRLLMVILAVLLVGLVQVSAQDAMSGTGVFMRVVNFSAKTPLMDVYVNGQLRFKDVGYKSVTMYVECNSMMPEIVLVPAEMGYEQSLTGLPLSVMFPGPGYYTAALFGNLEERSLEIMLLPQDGVVTSPADAEGIAEVDHIRISGAWARAAMVMGGMGGMEMPAATPEGSMGGMNMEATPEGGMAGHDMNGMNMSATPEGDGGMNMADMGAVSAIFMLIENTGDQPDTLIGVQTDVAMMAQIHQTTVVDGIAKMQEVGKIEVPAGGSAELKPGDYHIMLMGLKESLMEGQSISVTLTFASGTVITMNVPVKANT